MSVLSGRRPLLWFVSLLLPNCTTDISPTETPDSDGDESSESGDETPVPTTGPGSESTDTGAEPTTTGDDSSTSMSGDESSTGTGDVDDSTTGAVTLVCGDGILDRGEECDDGFGANVVTGACLPNCVLARCGDGFVQAGEEECDLGAGNSFDYGGCNELTCMWGPRCGDGKVDAPNEVCDPGDPNGQDDAVVACDDDCRFEGRIVFLSSTTFDGNLGGLAGADKQCRDLAKAFDGVHWDTYRAWLSDAEESPQSRFAHGPEYDAVPYVLRNGVEVAADFNALVTNGPSSAINLTDKDEILNIQPVWTNTGVDGNPLTEDQHCNGWTAMMLELGRFGINGYPADSVDIDEWKTFGQWTTNGSTSCLKKRRLYCFEN